MSRHGSFQIMVVMVRWRRRIIYGPSGGSPVTGTRRRGCGGSIHLVVVVSVSDIVWWWWVCCCRHDCGFYGWIIQSSDMIYLYLYLCTTRWIVDSGSRSGYPHSGLSVNIAVVVVRLSVVIRSSRSFRGIPSVPKKVDKSAALYLLSVPLEWQTSYSYIYSNVGI